MQIRVDSLCLSHTLHPNSQRCLEICFLIENTQVGCLHPCGSLCMDLPLFPHNHCSLTDGINLCLYKQSVLCSSETWGRSGTFRFLGWVSEMRWRTTFCGASLHNLQVHLDIHPITTCITTTCSILVFRMNFLVLAHIIPSGNAVIVMPLLVFAVFWCLPAPDNRGGTL